MIARSGVPPSRTFWIVSALSLAWNAFGCLDFTMTVIRSPAYLAQMPPDALAWLDEAPSWTWLSWALGTGAALVGSLLLLARRRAATWAFAASLVGLAANQAWQVSSGLPPSMTGPGTIALYLLIWLVELGLLGFAVAMTRRGVLR